MVSDAFIPEFEDPVPTGATVVATRPGVDAGYLSEEAARHGFEPVAAVSTLSDRPTRTPSRFFPEFGLAVLEPGERLKGRNRGASIAAQAEAAAAMGTVERHRPEFWASVDDRPGPATGDAAFEAALRDWARDGLRLLVDRFDVPGGRVAFRDAVPEPEGSDVERMTDDAGATWAMRAVGADRAVATGRGVDVCILDTGVDPTHERLHETVAEALDFTGGNNPNDVHGHGTHCAGLIAGATPRGGVRIGVAPKVDLYSAKVLGDSGFGREMHIFDGLAWAIERRVDVISASLSLNLGPGEDILGVYERLMRAARSRDILVVAAAGNASFRPAYVHPVAAPANHPTALAVGAIDRADRIAYFSNGGRLGGPQVDLVAPGVDVLSAAVSPGRLARKTGTSMATPIVAGIAALLKEHDPGLSAEALRDRLASSARRLGAEEAFGAGCAAVPAGV
ncbi:MAG: S8 family serine peptidase [Pseudomonadota bacterium]